MFGFGARKRETAVRNAAGNAARDARSPQPTAVHTCGDRPVPAPETLSAPATLSALHAHFFDGADAGPIRPVAATGLSLWLGQPTQF